MPLGVGMISDGGVLLNRQGKRNPSENGAIPLPIRPENARRFPITPTVAGNRPQQSAGEICGLGRLALLCLLAWMSSLGAQAKSPKEIFSEAASSVVVVFGPTEQGESQGSGVVVGRNEIITNCHVIDQMTRISVRQATGPQARETYHMDAELIFSDQERDLCLLYVEELSVPPAAKPVKQGSARQISVGDEVFAIGSPRGLELSISRGIVSQLRGYSGKRSAPLIQTDAAISPGSSGGGLFNENGELIGITTFKVEGEGLNFALPVEWAAGLLSGKDLHQAVAAGHADVARTLLEYGANPNSVDTNLNTPLYAAVLNFHADVARILLEHGADPNNITYAGTPLHIAAFLGSVDVARILLKHGADPNIVDAGWTPLHKAALWGSVDVARILLEHGADPNIADTGRTPLYVAAGKGYVDVARTLLEHGANPNIATIVSETPLHRAAFNGYVDVARILLEHGADPNTPNIDGETALAHATRKGHSEIADLLRRRQ